ncbi:hypothetical protein DVDV_1630 [Desulfovibrio sp. DV]|nr:hypothetical protein DVDV_1630 [Desulfovibrio sp. DV]
MGSIAGQPLSLPGPFPWSCGLCPHGAFLLEDVTCPGLFG